MLNGCALHAFKYEARDDVTYRNLAESGAKEVSIGNFTDSSPEVNQSTVRGSLFVSPYEKSFANYIKAALEEEIKAQNLLKDNAPIKITGELLTNKIRGGGFSDDFVGSARVSVRFKVQNKKDANNFKYNKVVSINHFWPSNFNGAVAKIDAIENYAEAIGLLISKLFDDDDFVSSIQE